MAASLTKDQKVIYAVGAAVLCYHEIERNLKFLVPFIKTPDSGASSALAMHKEIARKSLGEVVGRFVDSTSGDTEAFRSYFRKIVHARNDLVHHFSDKYGKLISENQHDKVLDSICAQHNDAVQVLRVMQELVLCLAELLRETTFKNTEEYEAMAALCERARAFRIPASQHPADEPSTHQA